MGLYENLITIALGALGNYFLIYRMNQFLGNIGFLALGLIMMATSTGNTQTAVGIFILVGSMLKIVHDFLLSGKQKKG